MPNYTINYKFQKKITFGWLWSYKMKWFSLEEGQNCHRQVIGKEVD